MDGLVLERSVALLVHAKSSVSVGVRDVVAEASQGGCEGLQVVCSPQVT